MLFCAGSARAFSLIIHEGTVACSRHLHCSSTGRLSQRPHRSHVLVGLLDHLLVGLLDHAADPTMLVLGQRQGGGEEEAARMLTYDEGMCVTIFGSYLRYPPAY